MVSDGAMGSELIGWGIAPEDVLHANTEFGAAVRNIHDGYIAAGARIITSNTFGLRNGTDWATEISDGVNIAVQAALSSPSDIGVWLSLVPCVAACEQETLRILSEFLPVWPHMLLVETCASLEEARMAARGIAALKPDILCISAHFRADGKMPDGTTPEDFAIAVVSDGAHVVGANCGDFPEPFIEITARMRSVTDAPLLIQPSAGLPTRDSDRWRYPVDPQRFSNVAMKLFGAGANIVGGCCGASRAHIAAVCAKMGRILMHQ
jgi:methionine synthase I (cobalamin-dependent)